MIYVKLVLTAIFYLSATALLCYGIWREDTLIAWEQKQWSRIKRYVPAFVRYIKKYGVKHFVKMVAIAVLEEIAEKDTYTNVISLKELKKNR